MNQTPIFNQYPLFDSSWEDYFTIGVAAALGILIWRYFSEKPRHDAEKYSPKLAWYRGFIYFLSCLIIAWAAGVAKTITRNPMVSIEQLRSINWWVFTLVCLLVVVNSYAIVWPRGTRTYGRKLYILPVIIFGAVWGLAEGQLFLSFWAIIERLGGSGVWTPVFTFIAIAIFNGAWHSQYWDIHVAPEHNIAAWNGKKVLFAHIPNLIVTLAYLAVFGNALVFVRLQTLGLVLSTLFMRFPKISDPDNHQPLTEAL